VIRLPDSLGIGSRRLALLLGICLLALSAARPVEALAKDGPDEARVAGVCGRGAEAELRLKSRDEGIELRFKVDYARAGAVWRVVLVHERRVAWRSSAKRPRGSFEVRRTLPDLPGSDTVTAQAWGPRGLVCRATATLLDT
jgi:hypothetical protein